MADVAELLEDLVRIPSPSGEEAKACERLAEAAGELGYDVRRDDVGNVLATAGDGPVRVLLAGHVDTVPGQIPVRVEDGVLHGRGAVDAKGPLAAFLHAGADPPDALTVTVAGLVGEEATSRGARQLLADGVEADHVVVGEPSGWDGVTVAYRGNREVLLDVDREGRHPGHPDPNAAGLLLEALSALGSRAGDGFDALGVHVRSLDAAEDGNASTARARVSLRYPDEGTLAGAEEVLAGFPGTVEVVEDTPPVRVDRTVPAVTALVASIRDAGVRPRLVRKTGTSDMNLLADVADSLCAYGPGDSSLDHAPDERIDLDEVRRSVGVLRQALSTLASR